MAFESAAGTFSTGTGAVGTTVSVTGLSFQPKAILFFWNGTTATTNTVGRNSHYRGVGMACSSTDRRSMIANSIDAGASSDGGSFQDNANCVISCDAAGAVDGSLDLQSMNSDGFTLDVTDVMPRNMTVGYVCYGGSDITNAATIEFQQPAATGTQDITSLGFTPDIVFFAAIRDEIAPPDGMTAITELSFGVGRTSTERAVWAGMEDVASATMDTGSYIRMDECIAIQNPSTPTSIVARADYNGGITNGFQLDWLEVDSVQNYVFALAIKGGAWKITSVSTSTGTSNFNTPSIGFTPKSGLFVSANRVESTVDTGTGDDKSSFGAATSTSNRFAFHTQDENGTANAEVTIAFRNDAVYANVDTSSAIVGLMDIVTWADPVTLVMDDADPGAYLVWIVFAGQSGTLYTQSVDTTVTVTPTLIKVGIKIIPTTVTVAESRTKQVIKTLANTVTTTESRIKKAIKTLADHTVTGTQSLIKAPNKITSHSVTTAQTLARMPVKIVTTTVSTAQTLAKLVTHTVSNTVTTAQTLTKAVIKSFSNTVSNTTSLVKAPVKIITTSVSASQTLSRQINKTIATIVSNAQTLTKSVSKTIATTVSNSATLAKKVIKTISDSVTTTVETIAEKLTGNIFYKELTDYVTTSVSLSKVVKHTEQTLVSTAQTVSKLVSHALTNTATVTATLVKTAYKSFTSAVNTTVSLQKMVGKNITTAVSPIIDIAKKISVTLTDVVSVDTALSKLRALVITTVVTTTTSIDYLMNVLFPRAMAFHRNIVSFGDNIQRTVSFLVERFVQFPSQQRTRSLRTSKRTRNWSKKT